MSTSSPPNPPSKASIDDGRRFKAITLPCEWVEDYRPGGYHPVILGDVFNRQYKVIRKLGKKQWICRPKDPLLGNLGIDNRAMNLTTYH